MGLSELIKSIFLGSVRPEDRGWVGIETFYHIEIGSLDAAQEVADRLSKAGIEVRLKASPFLGRLRRTGDFTSVQVKGEDLAAAKKVLKK